MYVDQADIPATSALTALARALSYLSADYELMAYTDAYTGLRWGEIAALTVGQIDPEARTVSRSLSRSKRIPVQRGNGENLLIWVIECSCQLCNHETRKAV